MKNLTAHGTKSQFGKSTPYLIGAFIVFIIALFFIALNK